MSDIKKLLGKKIKQIRKNRAMTQEQLAEMIGIEVPSLSNIETGKFAPSTDTLQKLGKALSVELWEFYYFNIMTHQQMLDEIDNKIKDNINLTKTLYCFLKAVE